VWESRKRAGLGLTSLADLECHGVSLSLPEAGVASPLSHGQPSVIPALADGAWSNVGLSISATDKIVYPCFVCGWFPQMSQYPLQHSGGTTHTQALSQPPRTLINSSVALTLILWKYVSCKE
jgi:hypothetical protein